MPRTDPNTARVAILGPSRNLLTITDVAREMRLLERDVFELLAALEQAITSRDLKVDKSQPAVPIVGCGGQHWIDLHALEWALGIVMDPQTPPSDWPLVAKTYQGARRAEIEDRLQAIAVGLFKPLRKRRADRIKTARYEKRLPRLRPG